MAKDIVIQLFIDLDQYNTIKEAAALRKITYSSGSELIRKILYDYCTKLEKILLDGYAMHTQLDESKQQSAQKEAIIEGLRAEIRNKNNEIEILNNNLKLKQEKRKNDKEKK
jgi:membrane carboxypeptidase/penicillin-binding protein